MKNKLTEEVMSTLAFDLLRGLFEATEYDTKKAWGVKVYSRFVATIWRAFQTTEDIQAGVSTYFRLINQSVVPCEDILITLDEILSRTAGDESGFKEFLLEHKELIVGRIQFSRPKKSAKPKAVNNNANLTFFEELKNA